MIFAMPNKPGEFSRFDFPEVLPSPLNGQKPMPILWMIQDLLFRTNKEFYYYFVYVLSFGLWPYYIAL